MKHYRDQHNPGLIYILDGDDLIAGANLPEDLTKGASVVYCKDRVSLTHLAKYAQYLFPDGRVLIDNDTEVFKKNASPVAAKKLGFLHRMVKYMQTKSPELLEDLNTLAHKWSLNPGYYLGSATRPAAGLAGVAAKEVGRRGAAAARKAQAAAPIPRAARDYEQAALIGKFGGAKELTVVDGKICITPSIIKAAQGREEREMDLWRQYKDNNDRRARNELMKSMRPIVRSRVSPWVKNSPLPKAAVEAEGMRLLGEAIETYDPNKGAQLKTHVWNRLNKIHRYGYTYQNVGSIPEPRAAKVGTYQNAVEILKDKLGREPTAQEIREELGWKLSDIISMQKELRGDLVLDQTLGPISSNDTDVGNEALQMVYYDANPRQKKIMEYTFDEFKSKPTLDNAQQVADKMKIPVTDVRKDYKWVASEINKVLSATPVAPNHPEALSVVSW